MSLGLMCVRMLVTVSTALLQSELVHVGQRQDVLDMLAHCLRRGLLAGQEPRIAAALLAQTAAAVDSRMRWAAAKQIGYVLNIRESTSASRQCQRPGGWAAVRASAESGARNAMCVCVGDAHVVNARIADECDTTVQKYMERWFV